MTAMATYFLIGQLFFVSEFKKSNCRHFEVVIVRS